ncbi:hypothetical protein THAOC_20013, partial [Thalassiosira oceanica]
DHASIVSRKNARHEDDSDVSSIDGDDSTAGDEEGLHWQCNRSIRHLIMISKGDADVGIGEDEACYDPVTVLLRVVIFQQDCHERVDEVDVDVAGQRGIHHDSQAREESGAGRGVAIRRLHGLILRNSLGGFHVHRTSSGT